MKRTIPALLLVLALMLSMLPGAFAAEYSSDIHVDKITVALKDLFIQIEGKYTSVNQNDSGALSIGIIQWHGGQAHNLLKLIVAEDPATAKELLGTSLYNEVVNGTYSAWDRRSVNNDEAKRISALLDTQAGHRIQDQECYTYCLKFIDAGWKAGMRTDSLMVYYATMYNQFGVGGVATYMKYIRATLGVGTDAVFYDLDAFHRAVHNTTAYGQRYLLMRDKTYNYIKSLDWSSLAQPEPEPTPEPPPEPDRFGFLDTPPAGHWAHEGIEFAVENGLFKGTSATTFDPNGGMTRAMLVTVLYRLDQMQGENGLGTAALCLQEEDPVLPTGAEDPTQPTLPEITEPVFEGYTDVPRGTWYTEAVDWATANGVVNGVGGGRFAPNDKVTREQIATILYRYTCAVRPTTPTDPAVLDQFADADTVSAYALQAMAWANRLGLVQGVKQADGSVLLEPRGTATRAQVAVILYRYCGK